MGKTTLIVYILLMFISLGIGSILMAPFCIASRIIRKSYKILKRHNVRKFQKIDSVSNFA